MKNHRQKVSDRPKKSNSRSKVAPLSSRSDGHKAPQSPAGRVHRTPDGTIEENSEEAAP
jgi:hypothetical protein